MIKNLSATVAALLAFGAGAGLAQDAPERNAPERAALDPVKHVPAWLEAQVRLPAEGLNVWVPSGSFETSALARVPRFPSDVADVKSGGRTFTLTGARNEQLSAQLAAASTRPITGLRAEVSALTGPDGATIPANAAQVRFVGYVPVEKSPRRGHYIQAVDGRGLSGTRNPDVVDDPLFEREHVDVLQLRAQPLWFTFQVPEDASLGRYTGSVTLRAEAFDPVRFNLTLEVLDYALPDPADYDFYLNLWMNPRPVAALYDVEPWSAAHWRLLEKYMQDLASRGQKVITTTIVEEPWQIDWTGEGAWRPQTWGGYESMVKWSNDGRAWRFDYSRFDRFVEMARAQGVGPWIGAYSLLAFRGKQRLTYRDGEPMSSIRWEQLREGIEDFKLAAAAWEKTEEAQDPRIERAMRLGTRDTLMGATRR